MSEIENAEFLYACFLVALVAGAPTEDDDYAYNSFYVGWDDALGRGNNFADGKYRNEERYEKVASRISQEQFLRSAIVYVLHGIKTRSLIVENSSFYKGGVVKTLKTIGKHKEFLAWLKS